MIVRTSISEISVERLLKNFSFIQATHNGGKGDVQAWEIEMDVNLWYVLDEDAPDVVYFRKQVEGPTGFDSLTE